MSCSVKSKNTPGVARQSRPNPGLKAHLKAPEAQPLGSPRVLGPAWASLSASPVHARPLAALPISKPQFPGGNPKRCN